MNKPPFVPPQAGGNPDLIALLERKLAEAKSGKLIGMALITITQVGDNLGVDVKTVGGPPLMLAGASLRLQRNLDDLAFGQTTPAGPAFETRRLSS